MKRIVRLTESDLIRLVKRVINEQSENCEDEWEVVYKYMEDAADKNESIDIRPYYCKKDPSKFVKEVYPNIDESKLKCLNQKIIDQYC
jgi:hypothetical protein